MSCQHCHHNHTHSHKSGFLKKYPAELLTLALLLAGVLLGHFHVLADMWWYYLVALLPVAGPVVSGAVGQWRRLDFFNEYTLMLLATVGAFIIGEYPEGVAVLLFYSIGEKLEDDASDKARGRIRSLLDSMPDIVTVVTRAGAERQVNPREAAVGDLTVMRPGDRVALDGVLESDYDVDFDTSAITGESVPRNVAPGGEVLAGYIPLDREARVRITHAYADSSMSRIMRMIEDAASRKSEPETLLRRITRWYTPAVMVAAALLFAVPWAIGLLDSGFAFDWRVWFERSLVLLVCSCPCALVVSVPLSYFSALGAASRFGVLFKGSRYLDSLRSVDTLVLDKTGTLTTGRFSVSEVTGGDRVLAIAAAVDAGSSHPLAVAICGAAESLPPGSVPVATDVRVVPHGLVGRVGDADVLVGSRTLLASRGVTVPDAAADSSEVCVAIDGVFAGAVYLDDTVKDDTAATLAELRSLGVENIMVLSGDRDAAVARVAREAGADSWRGQLLPQQKHDAVEQLRRQGHRVAFVGDGINDAPSLAAADVGIAIGTGGTDVAMESADAVITGNSLRHLADAFRLSRKIRRVVAMNVSLAIGVKLLVMVLGAMGVATLWAAVFADTGITLVTVVWTLLALRSAK